MTRSKHGLFAICAVIMGLMAFGVTAAQAEEGSKFLVLTSNGVLKTTLEASLGAEADTTGILHTKIAGVSVLFECPVWHLLNVHFQLFPPPARLLGTIVFLFCKTKLNGATSGACEPKAGGTENGVIKANEGVGLIELHELAGGVKDDIIKLSPKTGETLVTIEMGEECSIGEKVPIIGKVTLKDCENLSLTHLVKHLVEVGPLTEMWAISKTAEHVATALGSGWAFLTGAHAGLKFSTDPA